MENGSLSIIGSLSAKVINARQIRTFSSFMIFVDIGKHTIFFGLFTVFKCPHRIVS